MGGDVGGHGGLLRGVRLLLPGRGARFDGRRRGGVGAGSKELVIPFGGGGARGPFPFESQAGRRRSGLTAHAKIVLPSRQIGWLLPLRQALIHAHRAGLGPSTSVISISPSIAYPSRLVREPPSHRRIKNSRTPHPIRLGIRYNR